MPDPTQFEDTGATGFQPPRFEPIRAKDIAAIKKNYGIGSQPKFGKDVSDKAIYDFSTKTVIDWWRRQQAAAKPKPSPGGGGGGAGGGGTSGGSRGGASPRPPTSPPVKPMNEADSGASATGGKPTGGKTASHLDAKTIAAMLAKAGHPGWKPPAYALVSAKALQDWIARATKNIAAQHKAVANTKPVYGYDQPSKPGPVNQALTGGVQKY